MGWRDISMVKTIASRQKAGGETVTDDPDAKDKTAIHVSDMNLQPPIQ